MCGPISCWLPPCSTWHAFHGGLVTRLSLESHSLPMLYHFSHRNMPPFLTCTSPVPPCRYWVTYRLKNHIHQSATHYSSSLRPKNTNGSPNFSKKRASKQLLPSW